MFELEAVTNSLPHALRPVLSDCEALICEILVQVTHSSLVIELIEFGETGLSMMKHVKLHDHLLCEKLLEEPVVHYGAGHPTT